MSNLTPGSGARSESADQVVELITAILIQLFDAIFCGEAEDRTCISAAEVGN